MFQISIHRKLTLFLVLLTFTLATNLLTIRSKDLIMTVVKATYANNNKSIDALQGPIKSIIERDVLPLFANSPDYLVWLVLLNKNVSQFLFLLVILFGILELTSFKNDKTIYYYLNYTNRKTIYLQTKSSAYLYILIFSAVNYITTALYFIFTKIPFPPMPVFFSYTQILLASLLLYELTVSLSLFIINRLKITTSIVVIFTVLFYFVVINLFVFLSGTYSFLFGGDILLKHQINIAGYLVTFVGSALLAGINWKSFKKVPF